MITLSMMVSSFSLAFVYEQPILQNRGVDVKYFGTIFGGFLVIGMVGSYYLRHFNLKKSIDKSYVVLTGLMAIGIYFMSFHKGFIIPLLAMILLALLNGLVYPMKFIVMNSLITSDEIRSGVLSIESYLEFLSKSIISIFVGVIADCYSVELAVKLIALIPFAIMVTFLITRIRKNKIKQV